MMPWQLDIMAHVCRRPGMWTVTILAEHMKITRPRLAAWVTSLRRTGFITARSHALRPTQAGRLAFEASTTERPTE